MDQPSLIVDDDVIVPFGPRAGAWRDDPLHAFQQWIRSTVYIPLSKKRGPVKPPRAYSRSAQSSYFSMFARFLAHLRKQETTLLRATPRHIDAFLKALTGRQEGLASHETKRRALSMLDRVYGELGRLGLVKTNPTKPLFPIYARPPSKRAETTVLGAEQFGALLAYVADLPRGTFAEARRAAMLGVMVSCGITGNELRALEETCVQQDNGLCIVLPPNEIHTGGKMHLGSFAVPILNDYLALRRQAAVRGPLLFPATTEGTQPISHQSLHRHVVMALDAAGLNHRVGAQRILRATLAVQLLQANKPVEDVRKTLRLRDVEQIERYRRYTRVLLPF